MDLTTAVYATTRSFPKEELFGLTNQLRRAAVSVASNIAEGQGRLSDKELIHFLGMARGSVFEVQTQLEVARREAYASPESLQIAKALATETTALLNARITGLRAKTAQLRERP